MVNLEKSLTDSQMEEAFNEVSSSDAIQEMVQWQVYKKGSWYCIEHWDDRYIYSSDWSFKWKE